MTKPETPPQKSTHKIENDITLIYCSYPITPPKNPIPKFKWFK